MLVTTILLLVTELSRVSGIIAAFAEADTGLVVADEKRIEKPVLREMNRVLAIASRVSPRTAES